MVVTKSQLYRIIKEETRQVLKEKRFKQSGPSNPYHDEDGRFSSYDDSTSASLEDRQKEMKSGKNVKPCGRGQRRKCKKPQELKWESSDEPRSDSTSKFRRDDPRYENERMRTSRTFPGYDDMKKLADGIVEGLLEELDDQDIAEDKKPWKMPESGKSKPPKKLCLTSSQLFNLRQKVFNQLMGFISTYEDAKKASKKS